MQQVLLNTLYVLQPEGYLHLDNDTVRYEQGGETRARIPLHHVAAITLHANVLISPALLRYCSKHGLAVTWLDRSGAFVGSLRLPTQGNVLLRLQQFQSYQDEPTKRRIAGAFVLAKIENARATMMRRARDISPEKAEPLREKIKEIEKLFPMLAQSQQVEQIRGYEGLAARLYFEGFASMIQSDLAEDFAFEGRSKKPPRDRVNAMLSFGYTLATNECRAALEGVGLDPQIGFLHEVRPGRPALALDLVEELRSSLVDRMIFSLIHRKQIQPQHFDLQPGGAVLLNAEGRKAFLFTYQKRKEQTVPHPLFEQPIPFGLVPHVQARILARYLRGDIEQYAPFLYR
ncbi:MAG: type I-C CRISPR-associated endonuclease Cas1 [Myxococcales bacterium]|nr:type I-C CRISPR-associated endonuclease Cas1 [Myxococcales bacterium]